MGYLNTSPEDDYRINSMGSLNPTDQLPEASALTNIDTAMQKGVASAFVKADQMFSDIGTNVDQWADRTLPGWMAPFVKNLLLNPGSVRHVMTDDMNKRADAARDIISQWAETGQDPRQTGVAGRILSSTAEGVTLATLGSPLGPTGSAALLGGTQGYATYLQGKQQGLNDATATANAVNTGLFSAAGTFLPMKLGSNGLASIAGGTAINVGFGGLQRMTTSAILRAGGYNQMADQYKFMDGESMAADAILGTAFATHAHFAGHAVSPADVDAAAGTASDVHFARSAPGVPTEPAVANLHGEALRSAIDAMSKGDEPQIDPQSAQRIVDGVVPDPMHDTLPPMVEVAHSDLDGFTDAVRPIAETEPAARTEGEPLPALEAKEGEGAAPPDFDAFTRDRVDALAREFGDQPYITEDGTESTYREVLQNMQKELGDSDLVAKAHEAAAACFLRTGGAA